MNDLNTTPVDRILYEIYHIDTAKEQESTLYLILLELKSYIEKLEIPKETDRDYKKVIEQVTKEYELFAERIYQQLLKDNNETKAFISQIIETADFIIKYTQAPITLSPDLSYLVNSIYHIEMQYNALIAYINKYAQQCQIQIENDDIKYHNSYVSFVKWVVETYLSELLDLSSKLDTGKTNLKLATFTYLMENDYSIIDKFTISDYFTVNLVKVQNARLYRNREDTIIAIGDSIQVLNVIKTCWTYIYTTYLMLQRDTTRDLTIYQQLKDIIDAFLNNLDLSLLDKIEDLISKLPTDDTNDKEQSEIISGTNDLNKGLVSNNKISSYPELLDKLKDWADKFTDFIKDLQLRPDYGILQDLLNSLTKLLDKLNELLKTPGWINDTIKKINKIIGLVKDTIETINKIVCSIRQLLCIIAGYIHFMDSVVAPLLNQYKKLLSQAKQGYDDLVSIFDSQLDTVNNLIRKSVFQLARVKALAQTYQCSVDANKTTDPNWTTVFSDAVEYAITGKSNASILALMKAKTGSYVNDIMAEFNKGLTKHSGVNCPPIIAPSLSLNIPSFKRSYIASLDSVTLTVLC